MVMGAVKRYARHPAEAIAALSHPLGLYWRLWNKIEDRVADISGARRRLPIYAIDADWPDRIHHALGLTEGCAEEQLFSDLWMRVTARLRERGFRVGPESYFGWNDGDRALTRAIWCVVRHLMPARVVETGVGHGITTRFVLEAMQLNGRGHLWSIDLPPIDPAVASHVGVAVEGSCSERWSLLRGTSREHLPRLLREIGAIDLFIHDSMHTDRNVWFEVRTSQRALRPGAFMVVDDIDTNSAFSRLRRRLPDRTLVCEADPVEPDRRRFNQRGLFGIVLPTTRAGAGLSEATAAEPPGHFRARTALADPANERASAPHH